MPGTPGAIRRAWYQWKMMRFPWRKKWLVGFDLQGNTFWEFKDALHSLRNRRIAQYSRSTHYGDVKVSPSWMQWLRHTRFEPPTLGEQQQDMMRQERMKVLAAQADARWASKPSALDAPDKQQPVQMLQSRDPQSGIRQMNVQQDVRERAEAPTIVQDDTPKPPPSAEAQQKAGQEAPEQPATPPDDIPSFNTQKRMRKEAKDSPWKQATPSNSGDEWQPQGWSPVPTRRRT